MQQLLFPPEQTKTLNWFNDAMQALAFTEKSGWPDLFGDLLHQWTDKKDIKSIKVLSLFSGAGGLDIGFHDAGFDIIECNELEKDFAATLIENSKIAQRLHNSKIVCMDINDYQPMLENIDFIIGGPPCQTFSAASARAAGVNGVDDARGNLFKQYVRILKQLKPKGFLFENVYRIVGAQNGKPWKLIQEAFAEAGYKIFWRILDAADFGVPQFRERLIIVGLKEGEFQFPYPSHGPDSLDKKPYYSASLAIKNLKQKIKKQELGGRHGHLLNDIPPGLNYSFYTEKMGHPTPYFSWRSKFSDYLYKADPNTPVRTIKAQGGQYTGPFHWENRIFTIEELKRLQTFPDNYIINGNRQKVIHQLGNSVPPQLARVLAIAIAQQVFNMEYPFKIQLMSAGFELGFRTRKSELTKIYKKKADEAIKKIENHNSQAEQNTDINSAYCTLTKNFILKTSGKNASWDYYIEHKISNNTVFISLWDKEKSNDIEYVYSIKPIIPKTPNVAIKLITMQSYSNQLSSITVLWKQLETIIRLYYHKDDLVQFFGYYQYPNKYLITINYTNKTLNKDAFWGILSHVSQANLVGKIYAIEDFSFNYKIEPQSLLTQLRKLKSLGFEIRNHNTNKQIKNGFILIPYSFPTLNERSLQRLTEL